MGAGQGIGSIYFPILVQLILGIIIVSIFLILTHIFGPKRYNASKVDVYECGVLSHCIDEPPFNIKFYLVAVLFLIFDIEVVFLYPWATIFKELGVFGIVEAFIFLAMLIAGFVYAIKQEVLKWN